MIKATPLQYPFPMRVRLLYLDCWKCWVCGKNGAEDGGLEIHHILGRVSDSALNSSCLCKKCHERISHNAEEERALFLKTLKYLFDLSYALVQNDLDFVKTNFTRLVNDEVLKWLKLL